MFNRYDVAVMITSILEFIVFSGSEDNGTLSSLRTFRLFKIFKLSKSGDLSILIDSILFTITSIGDYTVLLMIFIYIFALLGMSFFASKMKFDPETDMPDISVENGGKGVSPRINFDSILWALVTIF